jgi:hypothetical protein
MRDSRVHTERVLADGPYRYVRNPLYLGNILMATGIGLMASRIGFLVLVPAARQRGEQRIVGDDDPRVAPRLQIPALFHGRAPAAAIAGASRSAGRQSSPLGAGVSGGVDVLAHVSLRRRLCRHFESQTFLGSLRPRHRRLFPPEAAGKQRTNSTTGLI